MLFRSMIVDSVERTPTGKADYTAVRERIGAWLAARLPGAVNG